MSTYSIKKPIPSCRVDKELILGLDKYLRQKASDLAGVREGVWQSFTVVMRDTDDGREEFASAEQLPLSPMPNNIESIEIDAKGVASGVTLYHLVVRFSSGSQLPMLPASRYEVSITGDTAREIAAGIVGEIARTIDRYRLKRFFKKPTLNGMFAYWMVGLVFMSAAWIVATAHFHLVGVFLLIAGAAIFNISFVLEKQLPHCYFHTQDNKERESRLSGWVYALISAIVGALLGAVVTLCYDLVK
jgi:hypothetical protein